MNAGSDPTRLINAQLRYYMHIDPATLSDNEWAMMWQDLVWLRDEERKKGFTQQFLNLFGKRK